MNLRLSLAGTSALLKGHPWIRAQDQLGYRDIPPAGTVLRVQTDQGDFLAWAVSEGPRVLPAFRVLSRERHADFGKPWWQAVVERALGLRRAAGIEGSAPRRLLNAESDFTPGLVCEACGDLGLMSVSSEGMQHHLPPIEAALIAQAHLKGMWRRQALPQGAWGPWHRSPVAPLSPSKIDAVEGPLHASLDLQIDAAAESPPWPLTQRTWRHWAAEHCAGQRVLALGPERGEGLMAQAAGPEKFLRLETGFLKGLEKAESWRPQRLIVEVPAQSKESFGKFDAAKHTGRLLKALSQASEAGAQFLLSSPHPKLQKLATWQSAWEASGEKAELVQVLAPSADLPELQIFTEGRQPRAFVFQKTV